MSLKLPRISETKFGKKFEVAFNFHVKLLAQFSQTICKYYGYTSIITLSVSEQNTNTFEEGESRDLGPLFNKRVKRAVLLSLIRLYRYCILNNE